MPTATSYLIQRSYDNVTFAALATITGSPLNRDFFDQNVVNPACASLSGVGSLIIGQTYVIVTLGSTTQTQWAALGVQGTALVGTVFQALLTDIAGSGTVQAGVQVGQQYFYQVAASSIGGTSAYTPSGGIIPCATGKECLGNLRLYAQQRINKENSQFVTTPEWNRYLTESYKEFYDIIVQKFGDDYYISQPYAFVTNSGQPALYPLPDGKLISSLQADGITPSEPFYKLMLCEVALNPNDPNSWVTLREYNRIQQNLWNFPNVYTFRGVTNLRYRLTGNNLQLVPQTQAGQTVRIWYIPRPKSLVADYDMIDCVSGWEEYVVVDACIKFLGKEESETQLFVTQKAALLKRIEEAAENRNLAEPETVSDSKMRNLAWTDDSGYGPGSGFFS